MTHTDTMMKKIILLLTAILMLAACDKGVTIHSMFSKAEQEKMGNAVKGTYHGHYEVFCWTHDGGLSAQKIPDATLSVTGWDKRTVTFHDFPVSLLSKTLADDSFVAHYFASLPDMDLTSNYRFDGTQYAANGTIQFFHRFINPISFTTPADPSGNKHYITIEPTDGSFAFSFRMEDCSEDMIMRNCCEIAVDIVDMKDNGQSLAGEWPSFTRMQVRFCFDDID